MYAVVDIAGFQEKVSEGDKLHVPTLSTEEGKTMSFDNVLLLAKSESDVKVGTPYVSGASVEVKVLGHGRGKKIRVFKMRRRNRYRRTQGHRQGFTEVEVTKIKATGGSAPKAEKKEAPKKEVAEKKEAPKKEEDK